MTGVQVDLVDIGGGNIGSVRRCLERLSVPFNNVDAENPPDGSRPLILPGVGEFGSVMSHLSASKLDGIVVDLVRAGTPFLGICVGMQILFEGSEEAPDIPGLGLVQGKVVRFKAPKVPQIGWNFIVPSDNSWQSGYVYFVNSFYPSPSDQSLVLYHAVYGDKFCAAVQSKNITAFQFHPEKSGSFGQTLLRRWLDSVSQ